VINLLYDRMKV